MADVFEKELIAMEQKWQLMGQDNLKLSDAVDTVYSKIDHLKIEVSNIKSNTVAGEAFRMAVKWVLGIIIIVGGAGFTICLGESHHAKTLARSAEKTAATINLVSNEVAHNRDDIANMGKVLEDFTNIKVQMAKMAGSIELTLEKVNNLSK